MILSRFLSEMKRTKFSNYFEHVLPRLCSQKAYRERTSTTSPPQLRNLRRGEATHLPELLRSGSVRAGSRPGRPTPQDGFLITAPWSAPRVVQNFALAAASLLWESSGSSYGRTQTEVVKTPLVLLLPPGPRGGTPQLGEVGLVGGG